MEGYQRPPRLAGTLSKVSRGCDRGEALAFAGRRAHGAHCGEFCRVFVEPIALAPVAVGRWRGGFALVAFTGELVYPLERKESAIPALKSGVSSA